jgi:hypothetical protein
MSSRVAVAATFVVLTAVGIAVSGCQHSESSTAGGTASSSEAPGNISGTSDDWFAAVCESGRFRNGGRSDVFPNATARGSCPAAVKSGNPNAFIWIVQYDSNYMMLNDLQGMQMTNYASGGKPTTVFAINQASNVAALEPLTQFGFKVLPVPTDAQSGQGVEPSTAPTQPALPAAPSSTSRAGAPGAWGTTPPATVSPPAEAATPTMTGTDAQGFVGAGEPRCNYTNPAVAIGRTSQSLIVICQTGVGRLYYNGLGLQNGGSVEIDDPVRTGTTFVATNNGFQYSVSPHALTITQGSTLISNEAMLAYWTN